MKRNAEINPGKVISVVAEIVTELTRFVSSLQSVAVMEMNWNSRGNLYL